MFKQAWFAAAAAMLCATLLAGSPATAQDVLRVGAPLPLTDSEQQMCAIGRGLMARPSLLLIDELSLGLAPRAVELLLERWPRSTAPGSPYCWWSRM
jgi:ABC-type arginine transport system ATPase subunit